MRADVAVVGAGPAGMAAALAAAGAGCTACLVDTAPQVGGQIYRQDRRPPAGAGDDPPARTGRLPRRFHPVTAHPRITLATGSGVWHAERHAAGFRLHCTGRADGEIDAAAVVLATGAAELVLPFPGWDLPGVVTAGAAQALLKAQDILIGRRVLVAGSGPLLLPVAAGLAARGARIVAVCERSVPAGRAIRHAPALARQPRKLAEAAGYGLRLARHGLLVRTGWTVLSCEGRDRVARATIARAARAGGSRTVDVDAVAVSHGFTPSLELARALGCRDVQHPDRPSAAVEVDGDMATSVPGVFAAGELTGIGGSDVAEYEGALAGAAAARVLGRLPDAAFGAMTAGPRRRLRRARRFAALLDRLYPMSDGWPAGLPPDTVICRCEEVTWGEIGDALALGAADARAVRGLTRCGMGYCQGRVCGPPLQHALAKLAGRDLSEVGDLHTRPVATPVPLSRLRDANPLTPETRSDQGIIP